MADTNNTERAEPVAWMDDGSTGIGRASQYRVVTDETKRGMNASLAAAFSNPLYAAPQPNAALADGWQAIATHDGRMEDVQLFCADTNEQFVGFPSRTAGAFQFALHPGGIVSCRPTHWRPLPAPPTLNASKEL